MATEERLGRAVLSLETDDKPLKQGLDKGKRDAQDWARQLDSTLRRLITFAGVTIAVKKVGDAVGEVVRGTIQLAATTAPLMQTGRAFEVLSGGAEAAERNLRAVNEAAHGTLDRYEAMGVANRLLSMRLAETDEDLSTIVRTAYTLSKALDPRVGATAAVEDFALMLANQSIMRLDQFGISSGRVRARVDELTQGVNAMTREAAFMQAVMEEAAPKVEAFAASGDDLATRLEAVNAGLRMVRQGAGERLQGLLDGLLTTAERGLPVLERLANGLTRLAQPLAAAIKRGGPLIVDELNKIIDVVSPYGESITRSLAEGIRTGTVYVLAAMMVLRGIITYWLKPGSPPKLLPDLTDWGKGAAKAWYEGWGEADFAALQEMSSTLQSVLSGLVAEGALEQEDANPLLRALRAQVASALNELKATGGISEATFAAIGKAGGPAGRPAADLARAYLRTRAAGARISDIERQMQGTTDYETLRGLNAQLEIAKQQATEAQGAYDAERAKLAALTEESNLQQQIADTLERAAKASKDVADAVDAAAQILGQLPKPEGLENPFEEMFDPEKLRADAQQLADTIVSGLIGTEEQPGPLPSLRQSILAVKDAVIILGLTILGLGIVALIGWIAALGPVAIAIAAIGVTVAALSVAWETNWMGMRDKLAEIWQGKDGKGGIKKVLGDIKKTIDDLIERTRILLAQLGLLDINSVKPKPLSEETDRTLGWNTREGAGYATGLEAWVGRPTYFQGWIGEGSEPELLQITPRSKLGRQGQDVKPTIIINNPAPEPSEQSLMRAYQRAEVLYG